MTGKYFLIASVAAGLALALSATMARSEDLGTHGATIIASIQVFAFDQALSGLKNAMEELSGAGIVS